MKYAPGLAGNLLHGAQQRRFLIQCLAIIGAEHRGDAQRVALDERIGRRIPRRVAARFKRGAQTARGEGRRVRLALNQLLAGKLHDDGIVIRGDERLVLFGGHAIERLEPVRVVRRALLDGPVLHGVGHDVGHLAGQSPAAGQRTLHFLICRVREALLHHIVVEHH